MFLIWGNSPVKVKEASAENPTGTFRSGNEFRDYPIAKGISTIEGRRGIDPRELTYNGRSGDLIGFSEVERLLGKAEKTAIILVVGIGQTWTPHKGVSLSVLL